MKMANLTSETSPSKEIDNSMTTPVFFFFHFTPLLLQLTTVSLKTNHITAYINDVLTEQ